MTVPNTGVTVCHKLWQSTVAKKKCPPKNTDHKIDSFSSSSSFFSFVLLILFIYFLFFLFFSHVSEHDKALCRGTSWHWAVLTRQDRGLASETVKGAVYRACHPATASAPVSWPMKLNKELPWTSASSAWVEWCEPNGPAEGHRSDSLLALLSFEELWSVDIVLVTLSPTIN